MPVDPVYLEPHRGYVDVREPAESVYELLEHAERYLTPEGKAQMYAEVGEALLHAIGTGNDGPVNRVVEGWLRTLHLKSLGMDEVLDDADPADAVESVDLSELRSRLT